MLKKTLLLAIFPLCALAQTPDWLNADYRGLKYSGDKYFTGYSIRAIQTTLSIQKIVTNQTIYEDVLSVKGSHTLNYTEAVRAAYKELIPLLGEIIKTQIQL